MFDADRTFVLDDVELAKNGEIKPPGGWIESHDGREIVGGPTPGSL